MSRCQPWTENDPDIVEALQNFLSWGERPPRPARRNVPPAWWAYVIGATKWCPPEGEW